MRLFVAVAPPLEVVADLREFLAPRQLVPQQRLRWTAPEQWHVTLAFIPQAPERSLDDLVERLRRACAKRRPLTLSVAGSGAFPHPDAAKVLWAGVGAADDVGQPTTGAEELRRLSVGCRAAAGKAGAPPAGGRFHPHLTLARLSRPEAVGRWLAVLDTYAGPAWQASQARLVRSLLGMGPGGRPAYETLGEFELRGGGDAR